MKSYELYYLAKRNLLPDAHIRQRKIGTLVAGARIHVSAVCGKAMASIACMLVDAGYMVTGSDFSFHPPMSDVLRDHHIDCRTPSIENLRDIDLFVPGNMLPAHDEEVTYARDKDIPMMSGSEVLAELLISHKRSLVVAGTHGKTTSSSLLVHVFMTAQCDPAYLIGGVFQHTGESYSVGGVHTTHAIFEGDEYDCAYFDKAPKFLRYLPTSAIITSIEHDHVDLYPTFEDYKQAFQFLVDDIPPGGHLVVHESVCAHVDISKCAGNVYVYGVQRSNDLSYEITSVTNTGTIFSVHVQGEKYIDIEIPLFGEYNVANVSAVFALALFEGLDMVAIREGLKTYPGVRERQEILGTTGKDVIVIRDFAHHPTAVSVTLQGLRQHYPKKRLLCVFEPRSITSRRKAFESVYPEALAHADLSIIVVPPFRPGDSKDNFIDISVVQKNITAMGKVMYTAENPNQALSVLSKQICEGDVVVFMSNGDFEHIPEKFLVA